MQKFRRFFWFLVFPLLLTSCEEIGPPINTSGGGNDSGDTAQQRIVLIEEFTGVQCVNCPAGHEILNELLDSFPDRIEVVSIYSGSLAVPINDTDPDLRNQDADDLTSYLGPFPFQPSAAIDRIDWETSPGTFERIVDRNLWGAFVQERVDVPVKVKLTLDRDFNTATRELSVTLDVEFQEITDFINATIIITESNIIAAQYDGPIVTIEDYVHKNVLRDVVTEISGELVDGEKTEGSTWSMTKTTTLPVEWNADNCRIVAFIAKSVGSYDVLQATGLPVTQ